MLTEKVKAVESGETDESGASKVSKAVEEEIEATTTSMKPTKGKEEKKRKRSQ